MKNKKQSEMETKVQRSSGGIFMKLFLIAMPLFILAVIIVFVLHIAGFNTLDWIKERGQSIPVVGEMFTDESNGTGDEVSSANDLDVLRNQVENRDEMIDNKDEQIQELEDRNADLEGQITDLEEAVEETEEDAAEETEENSEEQQSGEQQQAGTDAPPEKSSMTRTIESMKSKDAAAILENMENDAAITILEELSTGDRGDILQEMNVEAATTYSQMLMD
ncbi:magnesium transporter MgtE N-terminal domain-containing protein [Oceanobacillus locisalsi]|uniref:Magnesium transporter MgtE N-terminal domain-containing protein n=1 Tax=Oceanobacillus locisalsi TaxID=546107 RepID=A0ABW3NMA7_9BACI